MLASLIIRVFEEFSVIANSRMKRCVVSGLWLFSACSKICVNGRLGCKLCSVNSN